MSDEIEAHDQVLPDISPGALLEVMENPDAFPEIARADLYVQMAKMRERARDPEMPLTQRMDYMKFLARMGKVDQPEKSTHDALAGIPAISIVLPGAGQNLAIGAAHPPRVERDITPDQQVDDNGFGSGGGKPSTAVIP